MAKSRTPVRNSKALASTKTKSGKKWTIMVYMAGDNNLAEDMITGLKGMKGLMGHPDINLVALYDSNYPPVPVKIYEFSKQGTGGTRAQDLKLSYYESPLTPNPSPSNPLRESYWIKKFVPLVTRNFPADKYALILSGHSDGVIGKTLLRDENPSVVLDLQKLRKILYSARPRGLNGKKKKFDLLGFDGCLMSMVEIGYELRNVANVVVASEGNIPTTGWPYDSVLADLIAAPTMDERHFGKYIVERYAKYNLDYCISGRSIDISAVDLSKVRALAAAVHRFGKLVYDLLNLIPFQNEQLTDPKTDERRMIREHFIDSLVLAHYRSQTFMHNQAVDLVDFMINLIIQSFKRLIEQKKLYAQLNGGVSKRIRGRTNALLDQFLKIIKLLYDDQNDDNYIISSCATGSEYQFSTGTSIFFPWTDIALEMIYGKYADLDFNQNTRWLDLIKKRLDLTLRSGASSFTSVRAAATQKMAIGGVNITLDMLIQKMKNLDFSLYSELGHREHGGKEHGGKEHGGKGEIDSFYTYFSGFQNYDPEFFDKTC